MLALWAVMGATTAWSGVPAGAMVEDAVLADVTDEGLATTVDLALGLVPDRIAIPPISTGDNSSWVCFSDDYFGVFDGFAELRVDQVNLSPGPDNVLRLEAFLTVTVNRADDPMLIEYDAFCFAGACDAWVEPFPVSASMDVVFREMPDATGTLTLSPQLENLVVDYSLADEDLLVQGCSLSDLIGIADFFGISVTDLVLGELDTLLADLEAQLAPLNEDLVGVLEDLQIEESVDLLDGVTLDLSVALAEVSMDTPGIRLHLDGRASVGETHACVAPYDLGESLETPSDPPDIGEVPIRFKEGPALAAYVKNDFLDQALYAVWRTGLLCQTVDADLLGDALPLAFDTTLLPLFFSDAFGPLFPTPVPIQILTAPEKPPISDLSQGDLGIALDDFGLGVITELDGRPVRLVQTSLDLSAGVGLDFDGNTGLLALALDLSRGASAVVTYNEYAPGREDDIAGAVSGLLQQPLLTGILDGLLADATFGIPSFPFGVDAKGAPVLLGLSELELESAGSSGDFLGAYAWIGPVPYTAPKGGCEDSGCSSSTSTGCALSGGSSASGCALSSLSSTSSCAGSTSPEGIEDCGGCEDTSSTCDSGCSLSGSAGARTLLGAFLAVLLVRRRRS